MFNQAQGGRFIKSIPTRMPAVRCRRHKYASIIACCPTINNDTLAAPWTSQKREVLATSKGQNYQRIINSTMPSRHSEVQIPAFPEHNQTLSKEAEEK
jgi:hypothetical protein